MNEEKKRILKMVEEGKVTAEEAFGLLEELEKASQTAEQKQAEIVQELSTAVKFDEAKKEETVHQKFQSTKEKIFDFVDSALKKIKDFDLDFNFSQSVEISHIFHQGDAFLKEMDFDLANGSLRLVPWSQNDVRIECQAKVYRVDNQDQARQNFLKDIHFAVEGEKLRFATQQKWMKVDAIAYIPQTQYEKARIRIFNGSIQGDQLEVANLKVKTANGKIDLSEISGKKLEAETANGRIKIRHCQVDELEAETINGAIKVDGDFRSVESQSFNGNLTTNLSGSRCQSIAARVTTGSIDIFIPEGNAVSGELKSNLGGFNVMLDGIHITEEKNEVIQKLLRFQSVAKTDAALMVIAETKTGSISVQKADKVLPFK
jgi:DUF4097 and DUF4098 domain-containing protein YvlB